MAGSKSDVLEAGKWLAKQRAEHGVSTKLVASMATQIANQQGDPVKIHQQQLSDIENATEDKGPATLRPWFRFVRAAFESGLIAEAAGSKTVASLTDSESFLVQSPSGEIVGRLTWYRR